MKVGDLLFFTFEGDPGFPVPTHVAQITSVDWEALFFSCRQPDTGKEFTFQFSTNTSGPWSGSSDSGVDVVIDTHDIYTAAGTDPTPGGVALITFDDNSTYPCLVESVSPETQVTLYGAFALRLSFDFQTITTSEWDAHPAGSQILSIEGYVLNNEITPPAPVGVFRDGWWSLARRRPAHPGRIGGVIAPFATVVHTTDMTPETLQGLLTRWTTQQGDGACAHFVLGRDATQGLVQLIPITRNGSHAGGPGHGSFVAGAQSFHPNEVSVGIEVHCAGAVRQVAGQWRLVENGVPQGAAIPDADVQPDPQRPGRGWHIVTAYQLAQLAALLDGLEAALAPLPAGCVARSIEPPPAYGLFATGRVVGHVSLHAAQRGDPWPQLCDWLRAR